MPRKTAIIQRSVPFSGHNIADAIDMLMALGNFELPAAIFFIDDGVFHLNPDIDTSDSNVKLPIKLLNSLKFYDIEDVYVCRESMNLRNININALPDFILIHENHELRPLMNRYDQIIQF
ncbi:MAG: DsrE family protein [Aestuariibacter sp.]